MRPQKKLLKKIHASDLAQSARRSVCSSLLRCCGGVKLSAVVGSIRYLTMGIVSAFVWRFPIWTALEENWVKTRRDKQLAVIRSKQYWCTILILFLMIIMDGEHEEELKEHAGIAEVCISFMIFYLLIMQITEMCGAKSACCRLTASLTMVLWPIAYFIYLCLGIAEVHFFATLGNSGVAWLSASWLCLPAHVYLYCQYFERASEVAMGGYETVEDQDVASAEGFAAISGSAPDAKVAGGKGGDPDALC
jgi:hypothetical protein